MPEAPSAYAPPSGAATLPATLTGAEGAGPLRHLVADLPDRIAPDLAATLVAQSAARVPERHRALLEAEILARAGDGKRACELLFASDATEPGLVELGLTSLLDLLRDAFRQAIATADAARDRRDWPSAAEHYELAVSLRPDATFARVQLGHALKEGGRLDEAERAYLAAAAATPEDDDIPLHLGHARKLAGDTEGAASAYALCLRLNPANAHAAAEVEGLGIAARSLGGDAGIHAAGTDRRRCHVAVEIESTRLGRLVGRARRQDDRPGPVALELVLGGEPVLRFLAAQPVADAPGQAGPALGFEVPLPERFADGVRRSFDIRDGETATILARGIALEHRRLAAESPLHEVRRAVAALERQAHALQGRISELLAANSTAIEEYDLVAARHTTLTPAERDAIASLLPAGPLPPPLLLRFGPRGIEAEGGFAARLLESRAEIVLLVAHGACTSSEAPALAAAALLAGDAVLAYGDWDGRDALGRPCAPSFPPGFDRVLLLHRDYLGPVVAVRRDALLPLLPTLDPRGAATPRDLALRLAMRHPPARFVHIPRMLGHVTGASYSLPGGNRPPADPDAALAALGVAAAWHLETDGPGQRLRLLPPAPGPVSIIIASRDASALLSQCVQSILGHTEGVAYEILVVDHGSREGTFRRLREILSADPRIRFLDAGGPFNWARLNNDAAAAARGPLLLFLNNDTMAIHADWLARMVAHLALPGVAAVGPRLLYADGTLQHAGVVTGLGGGAGHYFAGLDGGEPGYMDLAACPREVAAVTGAAMLVRRDVFEQLGGFDDAAFAVAFNDVDFCLRLRRAGHAVVHAADAQLFHLESQTRGRDLGFDKAERNRRELLELRARWELEDDPFYNPAFDRHAPTFTRLRPPAPLADWLARLPRAAAPSRPGATPAAFPAGAEMEPR